MGKIHFNTVQHKEKCENKNLRLIFIEKMRSLYIFKRKKKYLNRLRRENSPDPTKYDLYTKTRNKLRKYLNYAMKISIVPMKISTIP